MLEGKCDLRGRGYGGKGGKGCLSRNNVKRKVKLELWMRMWGSRLLKKLT